MRINVALPAYNEAESLPQLLARFHALPERDRSEICLYVVNDGSTDATGAVARANANGMCLQVIDHRENAGLGRAVQTGIRAAIAGASRDDIVVLMDADDTHDPNLIKVLAAAISDGADIAIASRFVPGGDDQSAPWSRRLLSRGAAFCFRSTLPVHRVRDFTSGYRAYRASLLQRAIEHWGERLIEERGFACMVELLLKLRHCHPVVAEVPMHLEYDRKKGASKIKIGRTISQYLALALRDRLSPAPYREL